MDYVFHKNIRVPLALRSICRLMLFCPAYDAEYQVKQDGSY